MGQRSPEGVGRSFGSRACRAGTTLVPLVLALVIAAPAAAPPTFFPPYPPVLITINPPNPRAGDTLTIDVYTYRAGTPGDPDETPTIYFLPQSLPVTRVGLGHYRASYDLPAHDPSGGAGAVEVFANVSGVYLPPHLLQVHWYEPGLYLRLSLDKAHPALGDTVTVRTETFDNGTRIDPDNLTYTLNIASGYSADVTPSRESLGVYSGSFTIPTSGPAYLAAWVNAVAYVGGQEVRRTVWLGIAEYQAWFHAASISDSTVSGEIWVADETGTPSPGVEVNLYTQGVDAVTDSRGALPVSFNLGSAGYANVGGQVGPGTSRENFFITEIHSSASAHACAVALDPALMPDGTPRDFLRPGQSVTRSFRLTDCMGLNRSFANTDLDYAVWSLHEVVAYGRVHANAQAEVQVTFTAPEHDVSLAFVPPSGAPLDLVAYGVGSLDVGLNVSALAFGSPTLVRAFVSPGLQEGWDAQEHIWSESQVILLNPPPGERWERWTGITPGDDLYSAPDGMVHEYGLPTFLPQDGKWLVEVSVSRALEPMTQFILLGKGEKGEIPLNTTSTGGSTPATPPLDVLPLAAAGGGVAALVAAAGAWTLIRRRRHATRPPPPPQG